MTNETPVDVAKLVHDYLVSFHRHYKLPRHFDTVSLTEWCTANLGKQYKDWSHYVGHRDDLYTVLHVKDPKMCMIFELIWGHLIIGQLDIK